MATLTGLERQVEERRREGGPLMTEFIDRVGLTPERLAIFPLAAKLYLDYFDLLEGWARWARAEIEKWPDEWPDELSPEEVEAFRASVQI